MLAALHMRETETATFLETPHASSDSSLAAVTVFALYAVKGSHNALLVNCGPEQTCGIARSECVKMCHNASLQLHNLA